MVRLFLFIAFFLSALGLGVAADYNGNLRLGLSHALANNDEPNPADICGGTFGCQAAEACSPQCRCNNIGTSGRCTLNPCGCSWTEGTCSQVDHSHVNYVRPHFALELDEMERWLVLDVAAGYIIPALMGMAEEMTVVAMHQTLAIGSFFDAQMEMSNHRLLQEFQAIAHKDYQPSEAVCVFATNVRSLAATERYVDLNKSILSERSLSRHLGRLNDGAAFGVKTDLGERYVSPIDNEAYRSGRLMQFQDRYCNPEGNGGLMRFLCGNGGEGGTGEPIRLNRDTDFASIVTHAKTIDIDFTEDLLAEEDAAAPAAGRLAPSEIDLIALSKNLYGHKSPVRLSNANLTVAPGFVAGASESYSKSAMDYMRFRSLVAKRSVVENSFNTLIAQKAKGTPAAAEYMGAILTELGMGATQINDLLSGTPSYLAQMEILSKKVFENPQFYINLQDTPANVERQYVAVKAINLPLQWEKLQVKQRTKLLQAISLELDLMDVQKAIDTDFVQAGQR